MLILIGLLLSVVLAGVVTILHNRRRTPMKYANEKPRFGSHLTDSIPGTASVFELLERALVEIEFIGAGLSQIGVRITRKPQLAVSWNTIAFPVGCVFLPTLSPVQNMVSTELVVLEGPFPEAYDIALPVACLNMLKAEPTRHDRFHIVRPSKADLPQDLNKLLLIPSFRKQSFRIKQFAIWIMTDNPTRSELLIGSPQGGASQRNSCPTKAELREVRELFQQAGIGLAYKIFTD